MAKSTLHRMDFRTLMDLARSKNIKVVEARGLDTRRGVRFHKDGSEWIAMDSDLSMTEKIRTLGFLLGKEPAEAASEMGFRTDSAGGNSMTHVLTLCC